MERQLLTQTPSKECSFPIPHQVFFQAFLCRKEAKKPHQDPVQGPVFQGLAATRRGEGTVGCTNCCMACRPRAIQRQLHGPVTWADTRAALRSTLCLVQCSVVSILKFLIVFYKTPTFSFSSGPWKSCCWFRKIPKSYPTQTSSHRFSMPDAWDKYFCY